MSITELFRKLRQHSADKAIDQELEKIDRGKALGPMDDMWQPAALRLGEELSDAGPEDYYSLPAHEWLAWAIGAVRAMKAEKAVAPSAGLRSPLPPQYPAKLSHPPLSEYSFFASLKVSVRLLGNGMWEASSDEWGIKSTGMNPEECLIRLWRYIFQQGSIITS